jgi:hypothetical protein
MSSVDTRLKDYWSFATCYHNDRKPHWLTFLQNMASNQTGIAQSAAIKLLSRQKVNHESSTG